MNDRHLSIPKLKKRKKKRKMTSCAQQHFLFYFAKVENFYYKTQFTHFIKLPCRDFSHKITNNNSKKLFAC